MCVTGDQAAVGGSQKGLTMCFQKFDFAGQQLLKSRHRTNGSFCVPDQGYSPNEENKIGRTFACSPEKLLNRKKRRRGKLKNEIRFREMYILCPKKAKKRQRENIQFYKNERKWILIAKSFPCVQASSMLLVQRLRTRAYTTMGP